MNKDVLIHVRGLQMMETDDAQEPIEIVVPGQYYFRNGSHYLRYEEMLDDTAETTVNYIKMSPNGVEVRKQGQVNVIWFLRKARKTRLFTIRHMARCRWESQRQDWNSRRVKTAFR